MEIPRGGWGGGGFQKPNFLNESMTLKGNLQRGGGFNLINLPWEGYGYFLEQLTHYTPPQSAVCNLQSTFYIVWFLI